MSSREPLPQVPSGHDPEGRGLDRTGRLARIPALDGMRAVAVAAVLLFHGGFAWAGGGFMGVSMFFTLSGFLITSLLLSEHATNGRISLTAFYARRIRRLMPAVLTVILLVAVVWTVYPSGSRGLRFSDVGWATFYGTNLMLVFRGNSYQDLFADRSPLQHTWSLSLEEQIYVVFPLLLVAVLSARRLRSRAASVLLAAALASFAAAWIWAAARGNDRPYYATEARAGEFLLGAAFAAFWATSPRVPQIARWLRSAAGVAAGAVALAFTLGLWLVTDLGSGHLFRGATALDAALTCVLIAGAIAAPGAGVARWLGAPAMRTVGLRAYSLYLVHWPVFVLIDHDSTDLPTIALFVVRVFVSAVLAELLYRFVEQPVLTRRAWPGRALYLGCGLLAVGGLVVAPFAPASAINRLLDPEALALQQQLLANLPQITAADPTRAAGSDTLPARVLVVGDSQAWFVGTGMAQMWGDPNGVHIEYSAGVGCGTTEATALEYLGERFDNGHPGCFEWADNLPRVLDRFRPQVVVVAGGLANISDHEIDGRTQHIGEPEYDEWLLQQMRDFATRMAATGAQVLWLTNPDVDVPNPPGVSSFAEEDPARMRRYNALIEQLAAELDTVDTADLATVVKERPGGQFDPTFRPDGAHMLLTEAPDVVTFLADAIEEATARVA